MMVKHETIQSRIFKWYSLVFIIMIGFCFIGLNFYMWDLQKHNAKRNIEQVAYSVSEQLDYKNRDLYNMAVNVCSSNTLLKDFFVDETDPISLGRSEKAITNQLLSITGPMYPLYRIVLRRSDGLVYEYSTREINLCFDNNMIIDTNIIEAEGLPFFSDTFLDSGAAYLEDVPVISVKMSFPHMYNNNYENVIEVQERYDKYKNVIENNLNIGDLNEIVIFNKSGEIVYPYEKSKLYDSKDLWYAIKNGYDSYMDSVGDNHIMQKYVSALSGWTTVVLCNNDYVQKNIQRFSLVSAIISLISLFLILFVSYLVSVRITDPLKKIRSLIKTYNIEKPEYFQEKETEFDEITELGNTLNEMMERLQEYVAEVTSLKVQEMQSRYYALQSQMNPHFLYNSLSILSIMCEEQRNAECVEYCEELAKMLRYSSARTFDNVWLFEEMDYARTYLLLLRKRYDSLLEIDVIIPDELKNKKMPRLIIQPLVENSIKYGLNTQPPWFISVEAKVIPGGWSVIVSDTGKGFDSDVIEHIQSRINEINDSRNIPELEIGGMGIINIYIRLKLFYKERLKFTFGNLEDGGAFVEMMILDDIS